MKKLQIILFLLFSFIELYSQNLDSLNQYTGWDESNPLYKIQKLQINKIDYSKILDSGDKLFTADSNKYFRIWDLKTGKLLYWQEVQYQLPMLMVNDSLVVYWGEKTAEPWSPIKIYNLNETEIQYVSELNFRYIPDFFPFTISKENILFVSYSAAGQTTNYLTTKLLLPSLKLDTLSKYEINKTKYLFTKDANLLIREEISERFNQYTSTWSGKSSLLIKNLNQNINFSYDYYGRINNQNSGKRINLKEDKCFYYFNRQLTVYNLYDLYKPVQNTLLNDVYSFSIDTLDNLIYYYPVTNEIVKYRYSDSSYFTFNLSKNFGNCLVLIKPQKEDFVLTSNTGLIIQLNNTKIFSEKPKITPDRVKIIENQDVNFKIITMKNIDSALWDFGDGITSTELNPQHIYLDSGSFTVKLITYDGIIYDTTVSEKLIQVEKVFYPVIKADKYYGQAPFSVNFENVTKDFPKEITPKWTVDNDSDGIFSKDFSFVFSEGVHKVTLSFNINGKNYSTLIYINAYKNFNNNVLTISNSIKEGDIYSDGYAGLSLREMVYLGNSRILYSTVTDYRLIKSEYWEYSLFCIDERSRTEFIPKINHQNSYKYSPFIDNQILQITNQSNKINVFNENFELLYSKTIYLPSQNFAVINPHKFFGVYDKKECIIFNKIFEVEKKIQFNDLINNQDSIYNTFITNNLDNNLDYYLVFVQQFGKLWIFKYNLENEIIKNVILDENNFTKSFTTSDSSLILLFGKDKFFKLNFNLEIVSKVDFKNILFDKILFVGNKIIIDYFASEKSPGIVSLLNQNLTILDTFSISFPKDIWSNSLNNFYPLIDGSIFFPFIGYNHWYAFYCLFSFYQFVFTETFNDSVMSGNFIKYLSYPNPSENYINIESGNMEGAEIRIFDIMSNKMKVDYNKNIIGDKDSYQLDLTGLPTGTYFYIISNGIKSYRGKFIRK